MSEGQSIFDKAKDMASNVKDKVTGTVGENEDQIDSAMDQTGDFEDDKTGDMYGDKVDRAQDAARGAVDRLADQDDESQTPGDQEPRL
jgi:hypothetical protein